MGWLFKWGIHNRKELIADLRRPERFGAGNELLRSVAVGNNHWYLAKTLATGAIWIGLDLMKGGGRTGEGWGYKDLSEDSGPYVYNCPLHFLDKASPPTGYAVEWRKKVREHHEVQSARPVPTQGALIQYGGVDYRLVRPAAPRRGWHVTRMSDGKPFRMPAVMLNQVTLKSVAAA